VRVADAGYFGKTIGHTLRAMTDEPCGVSLDLRSVSGYRWIRGLLLIIFQEIPQVGRNMAITISRRRFVVAVGGAAVVQPLSARAQEPDRTYRLGVLSATRLEIQQNTAFLDQLAQLGFVQNKNLIVERQGVAVPFERFPQAAHEIVEAGVDAIFCPSGDASVRAAQAATRQIPIVGIADDMVAAGLVQSLSHPGANTTGVSILATELDGKRQEILMELLPAARRMVALADPATKNEQQIAKLQQAARLRGVELSVREVATVDDIAPAIDAAKASGAEALNVLATALFGVHWQPIVERTAAVRLPAIYQWPDIASEGFLAAYGPRRTTLWRQLAEMVAKVLRGASPSDLPVEQPTRFELVINLQVAKALGVAISPSLLLRADDVIE
jgi:putative tryptophan/tyrosine transport system substrate-binding protein